MRCEEVRDKLADVMGEAAEAGEAAAVREHLAGCAECRAEAKELARVDELVRGLPAPPAGSFERHDWAAVESAVIAEARRSRFRAIVGWAGGFAAAAAAVLLSFVAYLQMPDASRDETDEFLSLALEVREESESVDSILAVAYEVRGEDEAVEEMLRVADQVRGEVFR